jgi:hypothetical protein
MDCGIRAGIEDFSLIGTYRTESRKEEKRIQQE